MPKRFGPFSLVGVITVTGTVLSIFTQKIYKLKMASYSAQRARDLRAGASPPTQQLELIRVCRQAGADL